eukprot:GAHX01000666.1.p1 GENE.GAHX01000666.1~~GAHX01000666.1.p1  ORF type:complete len:1401 (-),score=274.99 GAHX01000666.1:1380-5582(-)
MEDQATKHSKPKQYGITLWLFMRMIFKNYKIIVVVQFIVALLFLGIFIGLKIVFSEKFDLREDILDIKYTYNPGMNYKNMTIHYDDFKHPFSLLNTNFTNSDKKTEHKLYYATDTANEEVKDTVVPERTLQKNIPFLTDIYKKGPVDLSRSNKIIGAIDFTNEKIEKIEMYNSRETNLGKITDDMIYVRANFLDEGFQEYYSKIMTLYPTSHTFFSLRALFKTIEIHKIKHNLSDSDYKTLQENSIKLSYTYYEPDRWGMPKAALGPEISIILLCIFGVTVTFFINFYAELIRQRMILFFDLLGISKGVQFLSLFTIHTLFTLYYTIFISLAMALLYNHEKKFVFLDFIVNYMFLQAISWQCFFIDLMGISFSKGKSRLFRNLFFLLVFFMPIFTDSDVLKANKFTATFVWSTPLMSIFYLSDFRMEIKAVGSELFRNFTTPFKQSSILAVYCTLLLYTFILGLLCFFVFASSKNLLFSLQGLFIKLWLSIKGLFTKSKLSSLGRHKTKMDLNDSKDKLIVDSVTKVYQGVNTSFTANDNVTFQISKGEKVALLGHNGAGKSTLMNILTGISTATRGAVLLDGEIIESINDISGSIGFCPQFSSNIESFTTKGNLEVIANWFDIGEDKIDYLLKELSLFNKKDTLASNLSGGQKRKLSFAMAILAQRKLIVLDEPSTGVDVLSRKKMLELLKEFSANSIVIYSTHLIEEAESVADRIVILSGGKVVANDTANQLKSQFNLNKLRIKCNISPEQQITELKSNFETICGLKTKVFEQTKESVTLEFERVNSDKLAAIYEVVNENRQKLGIISYGIYKPTLEEVLSFAEFREEANLAKQLTESDKNKTENKYTEIKNTHTNTNVKKGTSPFNVARALIYNTFINFITSKLYLFLSCITLFLITTLCFIYKEKVDKIIYPAELSVKRFQFNSNRKFKIEFINNDTIADDFLNSFKASNSYNKDNIEVKKSTVASDQVIGHLDKEIKANQTHVYFINLQDTYSIYEKQHFKGTELLTQMNILGWMDGHTVVAMKSQDNYSLLFSSLWIEYNVLKLLPKSQLKTTALLKGSIHDATESVDLIKSHLLGYGKKAICVAILLYILAQQIFNEDSTGLSKMWKIYGVPTLGLTFFNITTTQLFWFIIWSLPILITYWCGVMKDNAENINQILSLLFTSIFSVVLFIVAINKMFNSFAANIIIITFLIMEISSKFLIAVFNLIRFQQMLYICFFNPFDPFFNLITFLAYPGLEGYVAVRLEYIWSLYRGWLRRYTGFLDYDEFFASIFLPSILQIIVQTTLIVCSDLRLIETAYYYITKLRFKGQIRKIKAVKKQDTLKMVQPVNSKLYQGNNTVEQNEAVKFDFVTKIYSSIFARKPTAAIEALNFNIGKGESVALVGSNGAGKQHRLR